MNTTDTIEYEEIGFDNKKYYDLQKEKIQERVGKFHTGKLYLEIGGKFLYDPHAARVLPGFNPRVKRDIFKSFAENMDIIFCVLAGDITTNRQLKNTNESYTDIVETMLLDIEKEIGIKPHICVNLCKRELPLVPPHLRGMKGGAEVEDFIIKMQNLGYKVYRRYFIDGYPEDTETVLSEKGYGGDDYIESERKLILVTGAASNSGKMSTCLGQIYLDHKRGIESGYAKFETFPIWNLPLKHPVNLAYEAATADIGDYNMIDQYHKKAYGIEAVNYNRDLEAFEIVRDISHKFVSKDSFMRSYQSPTDMGVNYVGFCITNDDVVRKASIEEIRRRSKWYHELLVRGEGKINWINKCKSLLRSATGAS